MIDSETSVPIDKIENAFLSLHGVKLFLQRDDLLHKEISGNKWRKLKYNIQDFKKGNYSQMITFGGAFSNHIAATAAAGKQFDIPTIGIIRGEQQQTLNPTLLFATEKGMKLMFVSRSDYKKKEQSNFLQHLHAQFPNSFVVPEGGANYNGIKGCEEITKYSPDFDIVCSPCGTGSTLTGIISSLKEHANAIGIPVLKNAYFLEHEIKKQLQALNCEHKQWQLNFEYHMGGYAKFNEKLHVFIQQFFKDHDIKLDPIYTGKMMFGLYDMIAKGQLENKTILAIHTGGLQGIKGYESRYRQLFP
jgi:1-aminocyclopropane-1-carboxylate deaminase